jgi:hypothetical protein
MKVEGHPVGREGAHARLWLRARRVEHAADQCRRVHRRGHAGRRVTGRGHRQAAARRTLAHEETAVTLRLHQTLRQQQVVGRHHGGRVQALLGRTLAHAGQARAGCQQAVADAGGKALGQLLGQRLRRRAAEGGRTAQCVGGVGVGGVEHGGVWPGRAIQLLN